jgi:hypothetical protein
MILLQDFGDPKDGVLARAVGVDDIFYGMAPTRTLLDATPRKQLYVIDACRERPPNFPLGAQAATVWPFATPDGVDDRTAPVFAPVSGSKAFELTGGETLFSSRFLKCLDGAGGEALDNPSGGTARWAVTVYSLSEALAYETEQLKRTNNIELVWAPGGRAKNTPLHYLNGPPEVDVTLQVSPTDALPFVRFQLLDAKNNSVYDVQPLTPHPYARKLPAGIYRVEAKVTPPRVPYCDFSDICPVKPPKPCLLQVRVIS